MAIGGPIESVGLKGRQFAVAADADSQRDIGGMSNEIQMNGDSSARMIKTRKPWIISGLSLQVDDERGDHEFLQALADLTDFFPIEVTYPSGKVYQGRGTITGDLQASSQSATGDVTLSGPGKLTQQ